MCGIFAILDAETVEHQDLEVLRKLIHKRGPDFQSPIINHRLPCGLQLKLGAAILHLRGDQMCKQPVFDSDGNILLFNGQIYEYANKALQDGLSDTTFLIEKLSQCKTKDEVAETFARIDGPFAFIYWHAGLNSLYYGRDIFGRKSLCLQKDSYDFSLSVISSVAKRVNQSDGDCKEVWREVSCLGIHCLGFDSNLDQPTLTRFIWNIDTIYPPTNRCQPLIDEEEVANYKYLKTTPLLPLNNDLRQHSEFTYEDIKTATSGLEEKLIQAVRRRIRYNRMSCLECRKNQTKDCKHSKVSVAFSGGIDSTLIALALAKVLELDETIDLLTVAFKDESPDRISVGSAFREIRKLCPDRKWRLVLSDISKPELQKQRSNVISDLIAPCSTVLDDSLGCGCWFISRGKGRMLDSSIDDKTFESYFEDFLRYNPDEAEGSLYTSPATIFFAGMSIDEQLGGYSSHRSAWSRGGTAAVLDEISMLMRRLSSRNLGRDDRCCSHHSRDVKFPYLDFDLVSYLNQLPVGLKMNLDEPSDLGPKKLLRELAMRWGLHETARRTKRALQFGTRIANLEGTKERAADICSRLI